MRTKVILESGAHSFVGHAIEMLSKYATDKIGLGVIESHGKRIYLAHIPIPIHIRESLVDVWFGQAIETYESNPCSFHMTGA